MATINVRIDDKLKKQAAELFDNLGMDTSTAIKIFLRQAVNSNGIPFVIERPNATTLAAMREIEEMEKNPDNYKGYTDIDEMFEDLLK